MFETRFEGRLLLAFFLVGLVVAHAAFARAVTASDAQAFMAPGETVIGATPLTYQGGVVMVFQGSAGSLVLIDNSTGTALSPQDSVDAMSGSGFTISPQAAQELEGLSTNFSASVASCQATYTGFENGANGNCLEDSYNKFTCGQVFTQQMANIVPNVNMTYAYDAITDGLSRMTSDSAALVAGSQALAAGNLSAAGSSALAAQDAQAAFSEFYPAHQLMLTYPPFVTYGGLSACSIDSGLLAQINSIMGFAAVESPAGKVALESAVNSTLNQGAGTYFNLYGTEKEQAFQAAAQPFVTEFQGVDGARAFFVLEDEDSMNELANTQVNSSNYAQESADFNSLYGNATAALANAMAAFPDYAVADSNVTSMDSASRTYSVQLNAQEAQAVGDNVSAIDVEFITLEQQLRINGNASAPQFVALSQSANQQKQEIIDLANAPSGPTLPDLALPGIDLGLSYGLVVGLAVLVLVAAGFWYYREHWN